MVVVNIAYIIYTSRLTSKLNKIKEENEENHKKLKAKLKKDYEEKYTSKDQQTPGEPEKELEGLEKKRIKKQRKYVSNERKRQRIIAKIHEKIKEVQDKDKCLVMGPIVQDTEFMPTVKEDVEFSYQLYEEDPKNKNAFGEIEQCFGYYNPHDYINDISDEETKIKPKKPKKKKKKPIVENLVKIGVNQDQGE